MICGIGVIKVRASYTLLTLFLAELQATLADSFLADLDELSDNEAEVPVSRHCLSCIIIFILHKLVSLSGVESSHLPCSLHCKSLRKIFFFRLKMKLMLQTWRKMLMGTWQTWKHLTMMIWIVFPNCRNLRDLPI